MVVFPILEAQSVGAPGFAKCAPGYTAFNASKGRCYHP